MSFLLLVTQPLKPFFDRLPGSTHGKNKEDNKVKKNQCQEVQRRSRTPGFPEEPKSKLYFIKVHTLTMIKMRSMRILSSCYGVNQIIRQQHQVGCMLRKKYVIAMMSVFTTLTATPLQVVLGTVQTTTKLFVANIDQKEIA